MQFQNLAAIQDFIWRLLLVPLLILIASCSKEINLGTEWLGDEATVTDTGITYLFLKQGQGPKVEVGMSLETMVILKVGDSTEVWNTHKTQEPFTFRYGRERMIRGFNETVSYMREGDRVKAILPPNMGYGWDGSEGIPPNAWLSFDIEVVSVRNKR